MAWQFESLERLGSITEGPAWDGSALLFSNIHNSRVMRYAPESGQATVFREDTGKCNGLNFDADGRLYGCESGSRPNRALRAGRLQPR